MNPPKTILVVEDNPDDVLLIGMALSRSGVSSNMVNLRDGEQAIEFFRGAGRFADRNAFPIPSLVLLDLKMPRVDGFDVLRWIRSHPEWRSLPVVVLTTSYYGPDIEKAYNLGANSFLTKANDFSKFLQDIRDMATFWLSKVSLPEPGPFVPIPDAIANKSGALSDTWRNLDTSDETRDTAPPIIRPPSSTGLSQASDLRARSSRLREPAKKSDPSPGS
jgi:CheY-like chemotaxis protein